MEWKINGIERRIMAERRWYDKRSGGKRVGGVDREIMWEEMVNEM